MTTDLHGWCHPCAARVDHEDILDHAAREHPDLVGMSVSTEFIENMLTREQADTDVIYDYCDVVIVDTPKAGAS